MSIYKDNVTGKWRVVYRYTDWTGKTKQTSKRGFPTKREAQMWEHEQMLKHDAKLDMTFASFYEIYVEDKKERSCQAVVSLHTTYPESTSIFPAENDERSTSEVRKISKEYS